MPGNSYVVCCIVFFKLGYHHCLHDIRHEDYEKFSLSLPAYFSWHYGKINLAFGSRLLSAITCCNTAYAQKLGHFMRRINLTHHANFPVLVVPESALTKEQINTNFFSKVAETRAILLKHSKESVSP